MDSKEDRFMRLLTIFIYTTYCLFSGVIFATPKHNWDAIIEVDPESKSLIIMADELTHNEIKKVIDKLDQPAPQVLIKVLFLEVTHNDDLDVGLEAGVTTGDGGITKGTQDIRSIFGLASETTGAFYKVIDNNFDLTLRAMAQNGRLEVLSRPSVLARHNQEATITVGQEVPFIRNSRVTQDGQTINTVEYEDIGIILHVLPKISQDGLIELELNPEISTITGQTVAISDTVNASVFAKRSAETNVVVPDGKTVVIGGLIEDNLVQTTRKVPVLGSIPILGRLFSRKIESKTKTELMIFITPQIVRNELEVTHLSNDEKAKLEMAPKAFNNEQRGKFLPESTIENEE